MPTIKVLIRQIWNQNSSNKLNLKRRNEIKKKYFCLNILLNFVHISNERALV